MHRARVSPSFTGPWPRRRRPDISTRQGGGYFYLALHRAVPGVLRFGASSWGLFFALSPGVRTARRPRGAASPRRPRAPGARWRRSFRRSTRFEERLEHLGVGRALDGHHGTHTADVECTEHRRHFASVPRHVPERTLAARSSRVLARHPFEDRWQAAGPVSCRADRLRWNRAGAYFARPKGASSSPTESSRYPSGNSVPPTRALTRSR
jgi:hypothetical protein